MTEAEWLACTVPYTLMTAKRVQTLPSGPLTSITPRKMRLFGVACCRRASSRLAPVFHDLLLEVERQVDETGGRITISHVHVRAGEELERIIAADRDDYQL